MTWNAHADSDYDDLRGREVYTADNQHVGKLTHIFHPKDETPSGRGGHFFLVETGPRRDRFGNDEIFFEELSIRAVDPGQDMVILETPADALKDQTLRRPSDFDRFNRT